jgi:hypothetical protein
MNKKDAVQMGNITFVDEHDALVWAEWLEMNEWENKIFSVM